LVASKEPRSYGLWATGIGSTASKADLLVIVKDFEERTGWWLPGAARKWIEVWVYPSS